MLREAWTLAIEALSWMQMQRLSEPLALAKTVRQLGVDEPCAIRLARLLVVETVRRQNFIDALINSAIRPTNLDELDLGVQAFLRLYVYQSRIARHDAEVSVRAAENIVKVGRSILGWKTLQSIEPFLGRLLTRRVTAVFEQKDDETAVGLRTFHQPWFVKYCFKTFGRSEALALLQADVVSPPIYIRLNTLKGQQDEILEKLAEQGVSLEKVEQLTYTYKVLGTRQTLARATLFKEGLISIQDKAVSLVAEAADPSPGITVLDVCCAPGVRTTHLGQLMQNDGRIICVDYSRRRMTSLQNRVEHMGVEIAEPIIADARSSLPLNVEADLVLIDPPSTSTGIFGRLPSSKWRLTPNSFDRMAEIQGQMLEVCAEKVKPRGVLLYSTFSVTVEENEMLVERFLKRHPEFSLAEIRPRMGSPGLRGLDGCRRLYPHIHECSGTFIAKFLRNGDSL